MLDRFSSPLVLGLTLSTALLGCGSNDAADAGDEVGDTGTDESSTTTDGDGDGDTTTGDGDGDTTGDGDGDGDTDTTGDGDGDGDTTTDTTTGDGDCEVWEITYDLTGSEFEISGTPFGAGDQVNTVEEPYADDDKIGPGSFVVHFQDVAGEPGGQAFINEYDVDIHFVITGATTVTTDLVVDAGPEDCGIASGPLAGGTVAWAPATLAAVHTLGTILCEGGLCMLGGLPDGEPVPVDDTEDQEVSDWVFSGDLTTFTMEQTIIQMDDQSTTTWMYEGTEVSRELVPAAACLCE